MPLTRRTFLAGSTAAGALLVAGGGRVLAEPLAGSDGTTNRISRLFPGVRLAHADLHNHTVLSDGAGNPAEAFADMRLAGLDIAALTDHATVAKRFPDQASELSCDIYDGCSVTGIDERRWGVSGGLAESANADHSFTALRGFEWSSPTLGHMNVWFSQDWTDPASTGGSTTGSGLAQFLHEGDERLAPVTTPLDTALRALPSNGLGMKLFYDWLTADGSDGIAGFNHPGREQGRFGYFQYDARLRDRIVSMEVFNRGEDYLYEGIDTGQPSPITDCLDKGWRVGLLGVTDEHGKNWGFAGKGRGGLWVRELTRAGVREALVSRRFFSTRLAGLRVDAAIDGVQMGGTVPHRTGTVEVALDIDGGASWIGKNLTVQLLQTGRPLPRVVWQQHVRVPAETEPVITFDAPLDVADGEWVVLRITDPAVAENDSRATGPYAGAGKAVAYCAPFWLDPKKPKKVKPTR